MELLKCPFCGSDGEIVEFTEERSGDLGNGTNISLPWSNSKKWFHPKCSKCECLIDNGFRTPEGAAKEWNYRAKEDKNAQVHPLFRDILNNATRRPT